MKEYKQLVRCYVARSVFAASFALFLTLSSASAQSIDQLQQQRNEAEREIARIDSQLSKLSNSKQDLQKELRLTQQRYSSLQSVLRSIDSQRKILDNKENSQSRAAKVLSAKLDSLKSLLRTNFREFYLLDKTISSSGLLMGDSLENRRLYLYSLSQILHDSINSKSSQITSIRGDLGQELLMISKRKEELVVLKSDQQLALKDIDAQKRRITQLSKELDISEDQLSKQRKDKQEDIQKLQASIERMIRAEMERNVEKGDPNSSVKELTQEELDRYSNSFQSGGGKMLPPVDGAKIVSHFGLNSDIDQQGVKLKNNGVDIVASPSSQVRVVADGEVRKVFVIGTMGTSVLVRHGKYLTVYSNLVSTSVAQGSRLTKGEVIGELSGEGKLHFEVWYETTPQDPQKWIKF